MLHAYTVLHVLISLIAIFSGFVVLFSIIAGKPLPRWNTSLFLWTTVATSVTGFFFPFQGITPGIIIGILSLIVLAFALYGWNCDHLLGRWRKTFVITATIALYFNTFVLIAQSFQKIPALHTMMPAGNQPYFGIAQGCLLVLMILLGTLAVKRFKAT